MTAGNAVARGRGTVAAKRVPRFDRFVLLDHHAPGGALGDLEAALGFSSSTPDRTPGKTGLQDRLDAAIAADPPLAELCVAVVDITRSPARFAGNRATEQRFPASMGKLGVMFGAYQLRHDLRALAAAEPSIADLPSLLDRAADLWDDADTPAKGAAKVALRPKGPKVELHDHVVLQDGGRVWMGEWGATRLGRLFDAKAGIRPLRFSREGLDFIALYYLEYPRTRLWLGQRDPALVRLSTDVDAHAAEERLKLLIGFSNNWAPSSLARDLGLVLVNSPLWRAGLYHPVRGGLWVGNPYVKDSWRVAPGGGGGLTATALSLATLLAALGRRKVLDDASCVEVLNLLAKGWRPAPPNEAVEFYDDPGPWAPAPPGEGTYSPVDSVLRSKKYGHKDTRSLKVWSKLGLLASKRDAGNRVSDTALVTHTVGSKTVEYAVCVVDAQNVPKERAQAVSRLIAAVDAAVLAVN